MSSADAITPMPAGSYSVTEAARLVRVAPRQVRRYVGERGGPEKFGKGQRYGRGCCLAFLDLMELRIVRKFYEMGLPWPKIGAAAGYAAEWLGHTRYPLSYRGFLDNGDEILARDGAVMKTLTRHGQHTIAELMASLAAPLDYDATGYPVRWLISQELNAGDGHTAIIVDPSFAFGSPVLDNSHVPTGILHQTWLAEDRNNSIVAQAYRITEDELRAACRFEEYLSDRYALRA